MKKLINDVQDVLDEQLAGLAKAHPSLTLHQDPVYVTRADAPVAGKVALLSGGGSGHEPMHCGYIGQGMLSGACPGEIFTSPTPDKIFECAMQVDGGEGVLLIIKNYTGDILNFETATELLHDSGVKVTTVVIDDDVAVKDSLYTAGRRGVANTVLIEKLVGAAAERGDSLDACAARIKKVPNSGPLAPPTLESSVIPVFLRMKPISLSAIAGSFSTTLLKPRFIFSPWSASPISRSSPVRYSLSVLKISPQRVSQLTI